MTHKKYNDNTEQYWKYKPMYNRQHTKGNMIMKSQYHSRQIRLKSGLLASHK